MGKKLKKKTLFPVSDPLQSLNVSSAFHIDRCVCGINFSVHLRKNKMEYTTAFAKLLR